MERRRQKGGNHAYIQEIPRDGSPRLRHADGRKRACGGQRKPDPHDRGQGGRRPADRRARLGHVQAGRPDRAEDRGGRAAQLCLFLSGIRHSAVLAAICGGLRDGLQAGARDCPRHDLRIHSTGADRREPAGFADRGQTGGRRDRLHFHRAGDIRFHNRDHQQADGHGHSGVYRRCNVERPRIHQLYPGAAAGRADGGADHA